MSFVKRVAGELAARKLWPVALILLAALIAIPVLLAKAPSAPAVAPVAPLRAPAGASAALPVLSVVNGPYSVPVKGHERDPFTQLVAARSLTASTAAAAHPAARGATASSQPASKAGSAPSPAAVSPLTPAPSNPLLPGPAQPVPPVTPAPAPAPSQPAVPKHPASGLTRTESYHVAVVVTNSKGGVNTVDPVERLSVLPDAQHPLLIELGVLQGGKQVLFAVPSGTQLSGAGTCTPGPTDCEVISLGLDQVEALNFVQNGGTTPAGQLVVSEIGVDHHPSASSANAARRAADPFGRRLLAETNLGALSLFAYRPQLGAMVDLSNLTVENG